jgi:hypothetical protein
MKTFIEKIYVYIVFAALLGFSLCAQSEVLGFSCTLDRIGSRNNHAGIEQKDSKIQLFIVDDVPELMISTTPDAFKKLKSDHPDEWKTKLIEQYMKSSVDAKLSKPSDDVFLRRVHARHSTVGPSITPEKIYYEVLYGLDNAQRWSYDRNNGKLFVTTGPERGSADQRYFYSCKEINLVTY